MVPWPNAMADTMKDRLLKKFQDEIQTLDRELKLELPKEIKRARELGDLRENAEYQAAKERQRLVEARISMLQKRVSEIALINIDRIPSDRAGFGSTVHVRRKQRRQAHLPARDAGRRGRRQGPHFHDVAHRARVPQQGAGRQRQGRHARRQRASSKSCRSSRFMTKPRDDLVLPGTPHRAASERGRNRRRVSRRRAARPSRSGRQNRHRRRPRHRRRRRVVRGRRWRAAPVGREWILAGAGRTDAVRMAAARSSGCRRGCRFRGTRGRAAGGDGRRRSSCFRSISCCKMLGAGAGGGLVGALSADLRRRRLLRRRSRRGCRGSSCSCSARRPSSRRCRCLDSAPAQAPARAVLVASAPVAAFGRPCRRALLGRAVGPGARRGARDAARYRSISAAGTLNCSPRISASLAFESS